MTSSAVNGQPPAEAATTTLQTGVASYGGRYTRPRGRRPAASAPLGRRLAAPALDGRRPAAVVLDGRRPAAVAPGGRRPMASAAAGAVVLAAALALSACAAGPPSSGPGAGGDERVVVQPDTPFDPLDAPVDTQPDTPADQQPPAGGDRDPDPPADTDPPADADPPADPDPAPESRIRLVTPANRDKGRFGEVAAGESVTRSFAVLVESADPAAPVEAGVDGDADFALTGSSCDPAEGERRQCRVEVTFTPGDAGARSATLTVTMDGAAPARLALTGQVAPATAPVDLESTPSPSVGA